MGGFWLCEVSDYLLCTFIWRYFKTSLCRAPSSRPLLNLNFSVLQDSYGHPYLPISVPCKGNRTQPLLLIQA